MSIKPRCFIRRKVLIKRNVNKAKFSSILKTDFISLVIILSGGGGRGYNCNKTLFKRNCVATVILQFLSIRPTLKKKKNCCAIFLSDFVCSAIYLSGLFLPVFFRFPAISSAFWIKFAVLRRQRPLELSPPFPPLIFFRVFCCFSVDYF